MKKIEEKLQLYLDAGFPLIYINSFEEEKVDEIIIKSVGGRKVFEWNEMQHYHNLKTGEIIGDNSSLEQVLIEGIKYRELNRKILVIKDIQSYLEQPEMVSLLKNACTQIGEGKIDTAIILVSSVLKIPKELEEYMTILEIGYMEEEEIKSIIENFLEEEGVGNINLELLDEMTIAFKGLSQMEIENILALAYAEDGTLEKSDLKLIHEQKYQTIKKSGILEMVPLSEGIDDIGGLENLKEWLQKKAVILKNMKKAKEFGVELPKGVLIAGTPGCGKSLSAKATAKLLDVPLLKLDMGRIMGKYVGESEENMRKAIALSEAIAPCVLWVDELEKAFAGIGNSGGAEVTTRLFGQFLTWMQEKRSAVFVVATANDVLKLPPELLRKGRFDEIFYVGLPNKEERKNIFKIHIRKRRKGDLKHMNVEELAEKTEGYSGADIEGVVREAVENAFVAGKNELSMSDILAVIKGTHSLSELMKDEIDKMKKEYEKRNFKSASR